MHSLVWDPWREQSLSSNYEKKQASSPTDAFARGEQHASAGTKIQHRLLQRRELI